MYVVYDRNNANGFNWWNGSVSETINAAKLGVDPHNYSIPFDRWVDRSDWATLIKDEDAEKVVNALMWLKPKYRDYNLYAMKVNY